METCMSVSIPDGSIAANVPAKIITADVTTCPMFADVSLSASFIVNDKIKSSEMI